MKAKRVVLALCVGAFCIAMGLREEVNIWVSTGAAAIASMVLLSLVRRPKSASFTTWPPPIFAVTVGAAAGLLMSMMTWGLYPLSVEVFPPIEQEVVTLYRLLRQPPGPQQAFPLLLVVVVAEELVWRGLAIDVFSRSVGPWWAVVASAFVYVLPQVAFRSPLLMLVALMCGLVWGALRVRFKGVAAPLTAHIVWDLLIFVVYPVA